MRFVVFALAAGAAVAGVVAYRARQDRILREAEVWADVTDAV